MTVPKRSRILIAIGCLQGLMLAVITCGDFGFYFPGSMGNWSDGINWILGYLVVLIVGLAVAFIKRRYWAAAMQAGMLLLAIAGHFAYWAIPPRRFEAAQYQFLIGKSHAEVLNEIGHPTGGFGGGRLPLEEDVVYEYEGYNGMRVHYSEDNRVIEVVPD